MQWSRCILLKVSPKWNNAGIEGSSFPTWGQVWGRLLFGFISFSYCLVGKEEKNLINCTTINLWCDMAWAVITHREKQFTNSSKNSMGKILSGKIIILCIISIYALSHYSYFLLTLETVKNFPNMYILVGFSTVCVSSCIMKFLKTRLLLVSHCFFLVFQFLTPASKAFMI